MDCRENKTTMDDYIAKVIDEFSFSEVFAIVKEKKAKDMLMTTAKEEFIEDVIDDAIDLFGYDFVYGE